MDRGYTHHEHLCDCGRARLMCLQYPDQCDIRHFVCPKCQDDQLEADIHHMEALEPTQQEPTRDEIQ